MLRLIFVFSIILIGIRFAFEGSFYVLLFYLWNAYFRPEYWVWDPIIWYLDLSLGIGIILLFSSVDALRATALEGPHAADRPVFRAECHFGAGLGAPRLVLGAGGRTSRRSSSSRC